MTTTPASEDASDLLTPDVVARRFGVTTSTLRNWRSFGTGPDWIEIGPQTIRYRASALDEYLQRRTRKTAVSA